MATAVSQHRLEPVGPYDAPRLLAFVGAHAVPGVEVWDGTTYARSLRLALGPGIAAVQAARGGFDVRLALTDALDAAQALDQLRHLLDVEHDVSLAEQALRADVLLAPLLRERPGLRIHGSVDHAETLVRTVVGQQVSLAGARTVGGRLVAAHGELLPPSELLGLVPGVTHLFPTPQALAVLAEDDAALAMPRARARAVVAAARAVVAAEGMLPSRAELLAVPGVGPWTVDYLDLRCRRAPDIFLPTDLAARRALERLGSGGPVAAATATATAAAVARATAAWSPYRSIALMHLWAGYLSL